MTARGLIPALLTAFCQAGDLSGTVSGPAGKPVVGVRVAFTPDQPNALSDGQTAALVVMTDGQGRFKTKGLPEGLYGVTASRPGYVAAFLPHVEVPAKRLSITLTLGGSTVDGKVSG